MDGAALRRLRTGAGLSYRDVLADYPDKRMDKPLYSKVENGVVMPTGDLVAHILAACCAVGYLGTKETREGDSAVATAAERILPLLGSSREEGITRGELSAVTGLCDRTVREGIALLRLKYPVVNFQDGNGYYICRDRVELRRFERQEVNRAVNILDGLTAVQRELK